MLLHIAHVDLILLFQATHNLAVDALNKAANYTQERCEAKPGRYACCLVYYSQQEQMLSYEKDLKNSKQ